MHTHSQPDFPKRTHTLLPCVCVCALRNQATAQSVHGDWQRQQIDRQQTQKRAINLYVHSQQFQLQSERERGSEREREREKRRREERAQYMHNKLYEFLEEANLSSISPQFTQIMSLNYLNKQISGVIVDRITKVGTGTQ